MPSVLLEYGKEIVENNYILEIKIWSVNDRRYKFGVKYSLIFIELTTYRRILMDNHYPKGPHIHIDENEVIYIYRNVNLLVEDFKDLVLKKFGVNL